MVNTLDGCAEEYKEGPAVGTLIGFCVGDREGLIDCTTDGFGDGLKVG